jgi:hypothetical protein
MDLDLDLALSMFYRGYGRIAVETQLASLVAHRAARRDEP